MIVAAWSASKELHVISIPGNIGAGKVTKVTFITFSNGASVSNANITLTGAANESGVSDADGMLVLSVNATTNGSIRVNAEKSGYENGTFTITATPGLDVGASPASITSGTATFVTFSVTGMGKPVAGAELNLSGAGVAIDGTTNSNGQLVVQVNAPNTGKIIVSAKKTGYADGSTTVISASQQTLSISSSHNTLISGVPVYVTFTVTAGGSPVNDATVSLSGAAVGNGITNQEGKTVIQVAPYTTGTITASASKTGFAGGSNTITSAGTQSLSVASASTTVTAGVQSYVMFTVASGNNVISEALVTLTGAASGNGVTNQNGQAIILVNSTSAGVVTASASKTGYTTGSTTFTATGQQTLGVSASPSNLTNGVPAYITFTVTSGSAAVSGATVSLSGGGINADGMTNSDGKVTLQLNAAGTGTINVVAEKAGYVAGRTTLSH